MKPIYEPRGAAKEYGDLALNIYTGCPHRCFYCFAPSVLRRDREAFHNNVQPRDGIIEATRRQLEKERITGKLIHLCFTCDPYPTGYDSTATREIIKLLKEHGNHVQILTKGFDAPRDFDLLDSEDWFGVTIDGSEEPHVSQARFSQISKANRRGIRTWVSYEPVLDARTVIYSIHGYKNIVDKIKIGKLNYNKSVIDWKTFGLDVEALCKEWGVDYMIKDSLRAEMERK